MEADWELKLTWIKSQIENAIDFCSLRTIHDQMLDVTSVWKNHAIQSSEILSSVNRWHDRLISRVIELVLADMEQDGWGAPPSPFCWLLLGSGGRMEQTLQPDQDNALLYLGSSGEQQDGIGLYFKTLAEMVVTRLAEIGYPYCPGFVMATNSRWNLSLNEWQRTIESYVRYPDWDNARFLMMAADMRAVYGNIEMADQFRDWFLEQTRCLSFIHWQVADHGLWHRVALDFFDRFRIERWGEHTGELNIKEGGYLQIVNSTRIWSMAKGINATSTIDRITILRDWQVWDEDLANQVLEAFHLFLDYRLWNNYVCLNNLSVSEKSTLKEAMKATRYLQKWTAKQFRKPK